MKYSLTCLILLFLMAGFDTKNYNIEVKTSEKNEHNVLPFTKIELNDLSAFKPASKNWKVVGDVNVDRSKKGTFNFTKGTGTLLNTTKKRARGHLFTNFEHGDIELELDVMMPVGSNSGLYFQGRYEIQLLDSWGVDEPQHSDIGGIYQRWDNSRTEKGYEGIAPNVNAAKAPGLWQHFKIVFRAPRFDASGKKIKNAKFVEVWLNGVLLHENQELNGPTRSSAYHDEKPKGSLMIQGDHGAVAFKNMRYKLDDVEKIVSKNTEKEELELNANYNLEVSDETLLQRGFFNHNGTKKTHVISVGTIHNIHYAFDLTNGSLLQTWGGGFLNTAHMWEGRGGQQLAVPIGNPLNLHGDIEIAVLKDEYEEWPNNISTKTRYKQLGYELDSIGNPTFSMDIDGATVSNSFIPSENTRSLKRVISVNTKKQLWHKVGDGTVIELLPDGTYAIDNKNYFVAFSEANNSKPLIRKSNGKEELLVKIPTGDQEISYSIIW